MGFAPEPVYLGAVDRPWLAWRHRTATRTGAALVIVPPFGHEAVSAYRSLRHLALRAAAAGLDAWRIDLDGTGDSAGDDRDGDRVATWCASIAATVAAARRDGASHVILAGVRLGALLASRVECEGLIAIAPVVSGKKWLREMRALQSALGLPTPPPGVTADAGEAVGFSITPATREELGRLELVCGRRMLVIDRDDLPPPTWPDHVLHERLPGYVEMMLDAHLARVPEQMLATVIDHARAWTRDARPTAEVQSHARVAQLGEVTEEPVAIGTLSAIATRPRGAWHTALILLNAGAVRRIGPNRMYVAIARRCAAAGTLVVRADLAGIGDSPPCDGEAESVVYSDRARSDVDALVAWCRAAGADRVVVSGLCSGGHYTLECALAHDDIAGFVAINPGTPDLAAHVAANDAARYRLAVRDPARWKKLFGGGVDLRRLVHSLWTRARDRATSELVAIARRLGRPVQGDLGARLLALGTRGVAATFVFAADDVELVRFREQVGSLWARLDEAGVALRVIPSADHTFTACWAQDALANELVRALDRIH
jgi:pimeloyl-ACP methyl ester carboxylesterase